MSYQHPFNGVVPDLVEDVSLKRVRTAVNGEDAIRVVSAGSGGLDSQGVANAMATNPSVPVGGGSNVINSLSNINNHLSEISDAVYDPEESKTLFETVGTIQSNSYDISFNTDEIKTNTAATAAVLGTQSDARVGYNQVGTISGRIRDISNEAQTARGNLDIMQRTLGFISDSAWSGSGNGSLDAVTKRTSLATGTQSDAAWSGTGDGTVIALLKGIYNKL